MKSNRNIGKKLCNLMFPHSKRFAELSREAFQRWPPSEMSSLKGTLARLTIEFPSGKYS